MQGGILFLREHVSHGTPVFPLQVYPVDQEQLEICNHKFKSGTPPYSYNALPIHFHNETEVVQILKGEFLFDIGGAKIEAGPGDILNVNPNQLHSATTNSLDSMYIGTVFDMRLLAASTNDIIQQDYILPLQDDELRLVNHVTDPQAKQTANDCLNGLFKVMNTKELGYELVVRGFLSHYIACLFAHSGIVEVPKAGAASKQRKNQAIRNALTFIENNYSRKITIDDLAEELHYSRYTCCRFFKENFGTTFVDYLNNYRISIAHRLLQKQIYSVTEISGIVGFSSPSYFSKIYKLYIGNSPSQFGIDKAIDL